MSEETKTIHFTGAEPLAPPVGALVNGEPDVGEVSKGDSITVPAEQAEVLLDRDDWRATAPAKRKSKAKAKGPAAEGPADGKMAEPDATVPEEG
jgi:hypothetical protein